MAKDNSLEAKIRLVFASYPEAKSFHFTSDGNAFSLESDAKNHAKTLEDKEVREITKAMAQSGQMSGEMPTLKQVQGDGQDDAKGGAKNEFQAAGAGNESPYGTDDQGRNVSEIATDVAEKIQDDVAKATEGTVTDSSDAAQAAEKEAASGQAPKKGGSTATSAPDKPGKEAPKQVRGDSSNAKKK